MSPTADRRAQLLLEIRRTELELIAQYLPRSGRILELGGGNGLQAAILAQRGLEVVSLDVPDRPAVAKEYHPVEIFDGVCIPYRDESFDAIFSSNVLEHVVQLDALLTDTRRVLRVGGTAVHAMPTRSWRAWSSATYPLSVPSRAAAYLRRRRTEGAKQSNEGDRPVEREPTDARTRGRSRSVGQTLQWVWQGIVPGPHGHPEDSVLSEMVTFGSAEWARVFERTGFELMESRDNGLFYTGDLLMPRLSIDRRRTLAPALGASCRVYHTRPTRRLD